MPEKEVKNKKLDLLAGLVEKILDINELLNIPNLGSEESAAQRQEGQGLKILTPKQMITRLAILLAQLKAGNNSQKLKSEIRQLLYHLYRSKNLSKTIYNSLNSRTNESKKSLKPNKNIALANLSIYYTWRNIKSECNNNKFKLFAPTWNDEFNLPDGSYSVSDIQDCFKCIIKKHETIVDNPPVQIYVNKIKNRIVFKIKTGYKLELLTEETMQLLGS